MTSTIKPEPLTSAGEHEHGLDASPTCCYEWQARQSSAPGQPLLPPYAAIIDATSNCNSRCAYCDYWRQESTDEMSDQVITRTLEELASLGVPRLCFSGGEPLLRPSLLHLVERASDSGINVWINTNGILLNRRMAHDLVAAGLKYFLLSLDSLDPGTYKAHRGVSLDLAQRAFESARAVIGGRHDTRLALVCVLSRLNLDLLLPLVDLCVQQGLRFILEPYNPRAADRGGDDDMLLVREAEREHLSEVIASLIQLRSQHSKLIVNSEEYLAAIPSYVLDGRVPEGFQCLVGWTTINVHSHGEVKPCQHFRSVGNVRRQSLRDIWYSEGYARARLSARDLRCPGCWTCGHIDVLRAAPVLEG